MQIDKDRLDHDFGFLDRAEERDEKVKAASKYKFNWRNIIVLASIIVGPFIWISMSDNGPSSGPYDSNNTPPASSTSPYDSNNTPPASSTGDTVSNGQFRCSSYDSRQADALSPSNEFAIRREGDDLDERSEELDALSAKIKNSSVDQSSPQYLIDSYNEMISSYNAKLTAFKADRAAHSKKVDTFNAQVEARNNYLIAHCTKVY